jgi:hypothetical protein
MKYVTFFLIFLIGCADADINYEVRILAIEKIKDSEYCVYRTESIGDPVFEKGYFLDDCDKYAVGQTTTLTY